MMSATKVHTISEVRLTYWVINLAEVATLAGADFRSQPFGVYFPALEAKRRGIWHAILETGLSEPLDLRRDFGGHGAQK